MQFWLLVTEIKNMTLKKYSRHKHVLSKSLALNEEALMQFFISPHQKAQKYGEPLCPDLLT